MHIPKPIIRATPLLAAGVALTAIALPVLATTQTGPFVVSVTTSPNPYAILGQSSVTKSEGILGYATGAQGVALEGYATQPNSVGLEGFAAATSGAASNGVFGYSGNGSGVYGVSDLASAQGVFGGNLAGGTGVLGSSTAGFGVYGETSNTKSGVPAAGVGGFDSSGTATGVYGQSSGGNGAYGASTSGNGVYGTSSSGYGVYGTSASSGSVLSAGVAGFDLSGKAATGVYGQSNGGYGVYGESTIKTGVYGVSQTGTAVDGLSDYGTGVAGACGAPGCYGLYGNSNSGNGVYAFSNSQDALDAVSTGSGTAYAIYAKNTSGGYALGAYGDTTHSSYPVALVYDSNNANSNGFNVFQVQNPTGYLFVVHNDGSTYSANAISSADNRALDSRGVEHQMYAPRATEALTEDTGEAQLVDGRAEVQLDPTFSDILGHRSSYVVFITPEGDSAGLYVTNKTSAGFSVRENGERRTSLAFAYRIVGHPANEKLAARMPVYTVRRPLPLNDKPDPMTPAQRVAALRAQLAQAHARRLLADRSLRASLAKNASPRATYVHMPAMPFVYRPTR